MGQQWIAILEQGNTAFKQKQYAQAGLHYTEVLAEAKRNLKQQPFLTEDNLHLVNEFWACTQYAATAAQKNGQWSEAETIYLEAHDVLSELMVNLNNRLLYRAFVLTKFKGLFYALANLYVSNQQTDKLNAYVKKHQPKLLQWARELDMGSKQGLGMN